MKTCTKCKEEKELSEFRKQGKYLISKCKPCFYEYNKKYNQSDAHKKYQKEYHKEYRKSDAGKESLKKYQQSDARKENQKKYNNKYQKEYHITDRYFKHRLKSKGFKENDISPELIELQKLSIVTYRYTQQLNQVK
jgi:hypothetical protein